jgi:hypothetical protein
MTDGFREQARALNEARRLTAAAREALSLARDKVLRGRKESEDAETKARAHFREVAARERGLLERLDETSDPRKTVETLSDSDPLLLLPIRIETRFKTIDEAGGSARHELWLRVYPDDCVVDTFEPYPSDAEITATRLYWRNMWRAGGDENGARAAWKGLVGSCGGGRAAWLVRNYAPVNVADKPTKLVAHETLLIAATEVSPSSQVLTALERYWPAVWRANGAHAGLDAARQRLVADLGNDSAAADAAIAAYVPFNGKDAPISPDTRATATARFFVVVFPDSASVATQRFSWGSAPKAHVLPDRFVALGYDAAYVPGMPPSFTAMGAVVPSPLTLGIDPNAAQGEQVDPIAGDIVFGEDIAWMVDFDAAVANGMGLRIPISAAQARAGFDRIIVVGVRASAEANEAQALLGTLIAHHRDGRAGFSLLPQGAATNNTEGKPADLRLSGDADQSYQANFTAAGTPIAATLWRDHRDGARLAAALGLPIGTLDGVIGVNGADQIEARLMHTALFPGTLGYFLHDMVGEALSAEAFDFMRGYMLDAVGGRGPLPALRIGAQPYGVLPTTAFSRIGFSPRQDTPVLSHVAPAAFSTSNLDVLAHVLRVAERDWAKLAAEANWIGRTGDPHRTLLDTLGQHPASVEFYRRNAESIEEHVNRLHLASGGLIADILRAVETIFRTQEVPQLLARLGVPVTETLPISERIFSGRQFLLGGPMVDDVPLSETDAIRPYTSDERNYLAWLAAAALSDMDVIRRQAGFKGGAPPRALLYIILRFALLSGYRHEGIDRLIAADRIDRNTARALRRDPAFIHVKAEAPSQSRWEQLYAAAPQRIAGGVELRVHQQIAAELRAGSATGALREQVRAIEALQDLPTARLERLFAEHVDCLSFRVDAWRTGLAFMRLKQMRGGDLQSPPQTGVLLGAYGWVEHVRPRRAYQPFKPPADLAADFPSNAAEPLAIDPANQGYIHAPSLDHAVTAAVLRNGHMSIADPAAGAELAVNLSSERVRRALAVMQGMREGQSLPALLGYQFERGLHERHAPLELDKFIQPLRNQFPLDANRIAETAEPPGSAAEAISARNVIDGRKFADKVLAIPAMSRTYPFGLGDVPAATAAEARAIEAEADRLLDTLDAVSDLAIAESVHQAAKGNFDRAAGMMDAFSRGAPPPEPEVTLTPRTGVTLTHRVALHLDPDAPDPPPVATPRALAEPRVDDWLRRHLPPLSSIACSVTYFDQTLNRISDPVRVSVAELGLAAIDLVAMLPGDAQQSFGAFDERVLRHVQATHIVTPDAAARIDYTTPFDTATVTLFELTPLVESLRALLVSARPLTGADMAPPSSPYPDPAPQLDLVSTRISLRVAPLAAVRDDCTTLASEAAASAKADRDGVAGARDALIAAIDDHATRLSDLAARSALYGVTSSGIALVQDGLRAAFASVRGIALETVTRWQAKLADADAALTADATLAGTPGARDEDRRTALRAAEAAVSARVALADPPPAPATLRTEVLIKRGAFATRLAAFEALSRTATTTLQGLIGEARATLPVDTFERLGPAFDEAETKLARFSEDIARAADALAKEADARIVKAQAALTDHAAAGEDPARARMLDAAAKALFGEAFFIVPGIRLATTPRDDEAAATQRGDWAAAIAGAGPAGLLHYLVADLGRLEPVDEWLAGAARVRRPLKHLERVAILSEGFGRGATALSAFQVPYVAGDCWLGAEFPPTQDTSRDRLLYTAGLSVPWDATRPVLGLLIDEWIEMLPNEVETTGLAFHFDRPNAEPAQAMLLVVPPVLTGKWHWQDIVDAVNETLDLAKQRAVEPSQIDASAFARLLPSLLFPAARTEITLVADLAMNNPSAFRVMERDT